MASIRCVGCGRFIGFDHLGEARFDHEPSSHFGPEKNEWLCAKCLADEEQKMRALHG